jgi:geranylgeranyl diphosphate synthase type I
MYATRLLPTPEFTLAAVAAKDVPLLDRFERALEESVLRALAGAGDSPVAEHVCWHFGIGAEHGARRGKRLRPRLALLIARAEGATFDQALDVALAVELLHNYSLVHDDIEDGDELRHGRQTVWSRFGRAHGINAGDSICALSYLTLMRNTAGAPAERVSAMTRVLHKANLAMCAGQAYDIGFESTGAVSMDEYFKMIEGKTAVLFGAACALGALAAGVGEARATAYGDLGRAYGRAFQIRDDALGTWASHDETGKTGGADIMRRKWSFPIVWALGGPPSAARAAIAARYDRSGPLGPDDVAAIVAALDALGARRAAQDAWCAQIAQAVRLAAIYRLDRDAEIEALLAPAPLDALG